MKRKENNGAGIGGIIGLVNTTTSGFSSVSWKTLEENESTEMNVDQQVNLMVALNDVKKERLKQFKKWGEQNFPNQNIKSNWGFLTPATAQKRFDERTEDGTVSMMDILYEELCEMVAVLDNPEELEKELIQVVAVGVQWIEKLRRDKKE